MTSPTESIRYWLTGRTTEGRGQLHFFDRVREQIAYWLAWWAFTDERQDFYKRGKP